MNKTTTRFTLLVLMLLSHCLLLAQHDTVRTAPGAPLAICNISGNTTVPVKITSDYPHLGHTYEYRITSSVYCCFGQNLPAYNLYVPPSGKLVKLFRKFYLPGETDSEYQNLGEYYSPITPTIETTKNPSNCHGATGSIEVKDNSSNFSDMPRKYILYNANNVIRDSVWQNSNSYTFSGLPAGTYKVVIETKCSGISAEKSGIIVESIGQNPSLSVDLNGHNDCVENNVNASIILPESIPTTGVQYKLDNGSWQSSNTFTNVSLWQYHQFAARLTGCFETSTSQFISELRIPRVESLERAKDTDCIPANNEIRIFAPEGSDAQIQYNQSGAWYNSGQWVGPFSDGQLPIRVRSASLPSCYRDTTITLSEHGMISLAGANVSNTGDCFAGNIGVQIQTNPSVSTGLEYFAEGKGWQNSATFSGLSADDKRIAIRSTGLCQVSGVGADTLTLSETIPPQIAAIVLQGHDDCVLGNAGFTVNLTQSIPGVRFRANGSAWQSSNLFENRPAGNYLVEVSLADGTCVSGQSYALVETGSVSISGITRFNENDCVVGNARFQVLHTGGTQEGLKFRLNGGAWRDSSVFSNLNRMAVLVEAQIQKANCTSAIVSWADSIREQSNFPEVASISITNDKDCTAGNARVAFTLKVPMTATYWLSAVKNNTTGIFTGLNSGSYTFQVYKNSNGCVQTHVVSIDEKLSFTLDSLRVPGASDCINNNAEVVIHHPYGSNAGLQFREVNRNTAWQSSNRFPLATHGVGQYDLQARNVNSCTVWSGSIYGQDRLNPEISGVLGVDGLSDCPLGNVTAQVQLLNSSSGTTKKYRLNGLGEWSPNSVLPGLKHGHNLVELSYFYTEGGISKQCFINKDIVIDEKVKEISGVLVDASTLHDCSSDNAKVTIQVDGATSNLRYVVTGKTEGTSNMFTNLTNGQYKAIIRDVVTTCRDTFNFSIAETPLLTIPSPTVQAVVCYGASTGSISVSPTGGVAPYTYLWSTGGTNASISGLAAGTYTVTVTDSRACSQNQSVVVSGPAQNNRPQISFSGDTSICRGTSFTLTASGGGTYAWSTGATTSSISGTAETTTTYTLTVTNGLGCTSTASQRVRVNALPTPNIEGINSICAGQSTTLTATGGGTYAWQHGPTVANITVTPANTTSYKVTVTNETGCFATYNRTVIVNSKPVAGIQGLPNVTLCGDTTLTLIGTGGTSYRWSTGETTSSIQAFINSSRQISLIVKNSNACADTISAQINHLVRPLAQVAGGEIACYGDNTLLTAAPAANYLWSTGATTSSISLAQLTQTATYTVTLTNGLGCSTIVTKEVKVPQALNLNHLLSNEQDCIAKNVVITPQVTGGQGAKSFTLLRSGELYPYTNLSGWGSGEYTLVVKDSLDCVATKAVSIAETPIKITNLVVSGTGDCVPGNTQLVIETEGNRLPLIYRLNGTVLAGATTILPRTAGTYTIEVEDSAGCVASRDEYFDDYDALPVFEENITHVTDCSTQNGGIHMTPILRTGHFLDYSLSVDNGTTWVNNNVVLNLSPGKYSTAARHNQTGCIIEGPEVQINAPNCLPEVGFTKDTIMVTNVNQIIRLPWEIQTPSVFNQPFSLRIGLEGDGFPHLFDRPELQNIGLPELRSGNGFPRNYSYGAGEQGYFHDDLLLHDSAFHYQYPETYLFTLQSPIGSEIKIDPKRDKLRVIVALGDPDLFAEEKFLICSGSCITIGEDWGPEFCYSWTELPNETKGQIEVCPEKDKVFNLKIIRKSDLQVVKSQAYNVKVADPKILVKADPAEVCKGKETTLSWQFVPGQELMAENNWEAYWSNGMEGNSIKVSLDQTTTFTVTVASSEFACGTIEKDITVTVEEAPDVKEILPKNPIICPSGVTSSVNLVVPLQGDYSYVWSNGASTSSITVATPGTYSVSISNGQNCITSLSTQVRSNEPQSLRPCLKILFGQSGYTV